MECVELNPKGNFEPWEQSKLRELQLKNFSDAVGEFLFENDIVKLWNITLFPDERIPFRRRNNNYSWTCLTDGVALSRNANGKISLIRLKKGDMAYFEHEEKEIVSDIENIGENMLRIIVVEYKPLVERKNTLNIKSHF